MIRIYRKIILICLLTCIFAHGCNKKSVLEQEGQKTSKTADLVEYPLQDKLLSDVYTDRSRYMPGDFVIVTVEIKNYTGDLFGGDIKVRFSHLDKMIEEQVKDVKVESKDADTINFICEPPHEDYIGYLIEVFAVLDNQIIDKRNSAVDVSSTWDRFPRYGYLCNYRDFDDALIEKTISGLNKYHINGLQFYDWQSLHDAPLAGSVDEPDAVWYDIANRKVYGNTVTRYLSVMHQYNMMAGNYNLMFGASKGYEDRGASPEWALYKDKDAGVQDVHYLPMEWSSDIYIMNPANERWQEYFLSEEAKVFEVYDFDLFHVDTLGERNPIYTFDGTRVNITDGYTSFLLKARERLGKGIIMNAVGGLGKKEAVAAGVDFMYTEVWLSDHGTYRSLKSCIDEDLRLTDGQKSSVIAAYMNYDVSGFAFNEHAVKLTDAVIMASGGAHLELGDTGMLSSEYFPNEKMYMNTTLKRDLRTYYSFMTAYENLLRGGVTEVKCDINADGYNVSSEGKGGSIFAFAKESSEAYAVHLINLLSRSDEKWRDDDYSCEEPQILNNFQISVSINDDIKSVYLASPDINEGSMILLQFEIVNNNIIIDIPFLKYWDMVVLMK